MSNPYVGEIRMFAGNFPPVGWAFCDGQTLSIAEYSTLFNLIGTIYGGDGESTFNLPDLRGRVPLHQGAGTGLSSHVIGEMAGSERVALTVSQVPQHTHALMADVQPAESALPQGRVLSEADADVYGVGAPSTALHASAVAPTGGAQPHENLQPSLCVHFIIALYGIFPNPT